MPLEKASGRIAFQGVNFSYEPGQPILYDVDFAVDAGTIVGLSGASGSGKSTLLSLLPRFYDPSGGQVLLDGVDIRDYRLDDLRRQFSIVLQDTVLTSATVAENIAYSRPAAAVELTFFCSTDSRASLASRLSGSSSRARFNSLMARFKSPLSA